jgi:hypothetical protein
MGLVLGIIVAIGTVGIWLLAQFAAGMSDAPSNNDDPNFGWVGLAGGLLIAAGLIASHYFHIGW